MKKITFLQDFSVYQSGATISICSMTASNLVARKVAEYASEDAVISKPTLPTVEVPEGNLLEVDEINTQTDNTLESVKVEDGNKDISADQTKIQSGATISIGADVLLDQKNEEPAGNVSEKQNSKNKKIK